VSYLNTAQPGNKAHHLPDQAHQLVAMMRNHPDKIDMVNDWKLISIFIGGNDICGYCHDHVGMGPEMFITHIMNVLHVELERQIDREHPTCKDLHTFGECKCESDDTFSDAEMSAVEDAMNLQENNLMMNMTFDRDDFTVVVQPLLSNSTQVPRLPDGQPDLSYFTPDCFHFSAKLHSIVARGLWNNIVTPVGSKVSPVGLDNANATLLCPDPSCPFIRTVKNSANCAQYLTPAQG